MLKSTTDFRNKKWKIEKECGKFHVLEVWFRIAWSSFGGFFEFGFKFSVSSSFFVYSISIFNFKREMSFSLETYAFKKIFAKNQLKEAAVVWAKGDLMCHRKKGWLCHKKTTVCTCQASWCGKQSRRCKRMMGRS